VHADPHTPDDFQKQRTRFTLLKWQVAHEREGTPSSLSFIEAELRVHFRYSLHARLGAPAPSSDTLWGRDCSTNPVPGLRGEREIAAAGTCNLLDLGPVSHLHYVLLPVTPGSSGFTDAPARMHS
jgi:hypothetical protein